MEIFIKTSFIGFHYWSNAHQSRDYLRYRHRHRFNIYVSCEVTHNDRDVEFHDLIEYVDQVMIKYRLNNSDNLGSCEMMADYLYEELIKNLFKIIEVRIDEDDECGAIKRR